MQQEFGLQLLSRQLLAVCVLKFLTRSGGAGKMTKKKNIKWNSYCVILFVDILSFLGKKKLFLFCFLTMTDEVKKQ